MAAGASAAALSRRLLPQRGSECWKKSILPGPWQTAHARLTRTSIVEMAPKSTAPISSQDVDNTTTRPSWNTSPNTFPQFYTKLLKWLPKQETKYTTLVQYYYVLNRGQVCCVSVNHAARASAKLLVKGSFKNPQHVTPSEVAPAPPLASHPSLTSPPPTPVAHGGTAGVAPPPTPVSTVTSPGDPNNKNRYVEMYEVATTARTSASSRSHALPIDSTCGLC